MKQLLKDFFKDESGIFGIIAIAATLVGGALQGASTVLGTQAAKKAEKASRGQQELESARQRLQAVREARIRRAEAAQGAENQGASSSSAAAGAQASIGTQLQSNLGFIETSRANNATISDARLAANRAQLIGAVGQSFVGFGSSAAGFNNFRQRKKAIEEANANSQSTRVTGG